MGVVLRLLLFAPPCVSSCLWSCLSSSSSSSSARCVCPLQAEGGAGRGGLGALRLNRNQRSCRVWVGLLIQMFLCFRNYVFQKRFVKFDGKNLMYFGSEKVGIPVRFRSTSPGQTGSFWVGLAKGGTQNPSRK